MHDENGNSIFKRRVLISGLCGTFGGTLAGPFNLIRIQMQSAASAEELAHGYQHHHEGMMQAFRNQLRKHGVNYNLKIKKKYSCFYTKQFLQPYNIWRAYYPNPLRTFCVSATQLTTYDYCKDWLNYTDFIPSENRRTITLLSTLIAGIVTSAMYGPFDLISTRMANQGKT